MTAHTYIFLLSLCWEVCTNNTSSFDIIREESDVQIHGILGNNFFLKEGWIIDFDKQLVLKPNVRRHTILIFHSYPNSELVRICWMNILNSKIVEKQHPLFGAKCDKMIAFRQFYLHANFSHFTG